MKRKKIAGVVFGHKSTLEVVEYSKSYGKEWKKLFDKWLGLHVAMKASFSRAPNLPEGLSEGAFCIATGAVKLISLKGQQSSSFDTFDVVKSRAQQVKASIMEKDLTSFGPRSKWDDLYFLDFYNHGKLDGTFDVYKLSSKLILTVNVSKTESFLDQQKQGRRPRFSIKKELIEKGRLKPLMKDVRVWTF